MPNEEKTAREELTEWIKIKWEQFLHWLKPNTTDHQALQIIKTILKIPIVLLAIAASPVLLILLGIAFFLLL